VSEDRVLERLHVQRVHFFKAPEGPLLTVEELQHHDPANVFLQISVDARDRHAYATVGLAHFAAEDHRRPKDQRQHRKGDERQPPLDPQHDAKNAGKHENVLEDRHHAGGEHFVYGVDVGRNPRDESSYRVAIEERDVQPLHVRENLAAQIEHGFLADPLHVVSLEELHEEADGQQRDIDRGDLRNPNDRLGAEPGVEQGMMAGGARACQVLVDGNFGEIRTENVSAGFDQDGDDRQHRLPFVRSQIGEQSFHQTAVVRLA